MDDILNGPENGEMSAEGEEGAIALPNFGANEANGLSQDGAAKNEPPKAWEEPLRIPEIRKSSNNWSLASDAGLLLYLQEFSQKMIAKTSDLEKQVDGLVNDCKSTDSRVHNVFNDFLMLANTQFIENRVYDDADDLDGDKDFVQSARKDESKSREQREAEVIPRVTKALSLGINVLDTAFEQLDPHVGDSDSEEEDATYKAVDPILEPKDLYAHRALPYIIGTPAFMQDDDVGLAYSDEEDELSEEEDEEDEGESDLSDESEFSETESSDMEESDTTGTTRSKKGLDTKSGTEESDDGELFGPDDDNEEEEEETTKVKAPGYADELAAKLGAAAAAGTEGGDADEERQRTISETSSKGRKRKKGSPSKEKEKGRKKRGESKTSEDNLFGEPAEFEDEESPFSKKGLFSASGGGGLFDDDKEEGGLFDEKPSAQGVEDEPAHDHIYEDIKGVHTDPKTTRTGKKIPAGGVALFGAEGAEDLFGSSPQSKEAGPEENIVNEYNQQNKDTKHKASDPAAVSKTSAAKGGLFDDQDEDDLFAESTSKAAATKKGSKGVDLFGNEGEDDLFGDKPEVKKEAPKKKLPAGAVPIFGDAPNPLAGKLSPTKTPSDEDEEEEKKTPPVAKKPAAAKSGGGGGLFAEEDGDLFSSGRPADSKPSQEKKPSKGSLFDEGDDDDTDIFATPPQPKGNRPKADSSLFDDLEDEGDAGDLFAKPMETGKKKPPGGVALFGGQEVFGSPPKKEPEKPPEIKTPEIRDRRTNTLSLFNDDDEKDELFRKPPNENRLDVSDIEDRQNRRRAKSKSVFDDEDVLFGNKNEEDPSVDLFGYGSPVSPEKPQAEDEELIYENADTLKDQDGLFEDEDDDLFGETPKPPTVVQAKTVGKKQGSRSGGLFGEEEDSDLFGGGGGGGRKKENVPQYAESKKKNEQGSATNQETAGKRKKPVGGVAMFGGIDPLNTTAAASATKNGNRKKPSTPTTPEDKADSPKLASSPGLTTAAKPSGFKSVSSPKGKSSQIAALQANLGIDPSALMPGAAPPSREVEPEPVGFDQPAQVKTLDSDIAKNRAKMSAKRRPPSRNSRINAARLSTNPAMYGDAVSEPEVPEEAYQDLPSPSRLLPTKPKSKPPGKDIFANDDLFGGDSASDRSIASSIPKPETKRTPPPTVSKVKPSSLDDDDDLFASSVLPKKETQKTETKKAVPDFVGDDLFADSSVLPKKEKKVKAAAIGVDDDLFADSTVTKKASSKPAVVDDDLFATAPSTSPKKKEAKKQPVIEDDEDDLFGEKKETPKKTKTKTSKADKDLFSDPTDIFANIPSKPKEKKKKKQDQGIFGDVPGDDIFASPSASAKPKKTKAKKKAAEKKPSSADDIFSTDAPSIFDDPLSAMKN